MSTIEIQERCPVCGIELVFPPEGESEQIACPAKYCGVKLQRDEHRKWQPMTFQIVHDYTYFVLPFTFDVREDCNPYQQVRNSSRWVRKLFVGNLEENVDRTEYFLPYLRRFLFPELFEEGNGETAKSRTEEPTCQQYEFDLTLLNPSLHRGKIELLMESQDRRNRRDLEIPIRIPRISLILFGYQVGFLLVEVGSGRDGATLFEQKDIQNFLRVVSPLYEGFQLPTLKTANLTFQVPQLLKWLLQEFSPSSQANFSSPQEIPEQTPWPVKLVYDDRMLIYSFSCVDRESGYEDTERSANALFRAAVIKPEKGPERNLLREGYHEGEEWMRHRWEGYSKDGGELIVFNTDRFHERFIGRYHGTYYFDIFLVAVLQRVTLLSLFERMSDIDTLTGNSKESRRTLQRVRYDLLRFKNQCWFSQITNRERGLELWQKWQRVFETRTLLSEVNEQSEELDTYFRSRTREMFENLVRIGTFLTIAVPAVFGMNVLFGDRPWVETAKWILLIVIISGSGLAALYLYYRKQNEF